MQPALAPPRALASRWDAIVLLQMGGPADLDGIEPFLAALFADEDIIRLPRWMRPFQPALARYVARKRTPKVRPRYEAMGGGSPLGRITRAQADALAKQAGLPVHVAMRYTAPWARDVVAQLAADHARRVLLVPLYPHHSISTTQSNLRDFARAAAALDAEVSFVRDWGMHPAYLDLVERTCIETLATVRARTGEPAHLVFSAHGVPVRYVTRDGDTYQREVEATARALASRLTGAFGSVAQGYQSGLGPVEWLGPDTGELVTRLGRDGARALVLSPLGFVSDHIETLHDMDTLFAEAARAAGIAHYHRVPSFNDRQDFADVLAAVAAGPSTRLARA